MPNYEWQVKQAVNDFMYIVSRIQNESGYADYTLEDIIKMMIESPTQGETLNLETIGSLSNHISFELQDRNLDWSEEACNDHWSRR